MTFQEQPNLSRSGDRWLNVGVHPTPVNLASEFAESTINSFVGARHFPNRHQTLQILDACAGDGRLGHAVAERLVELGWSVDLTLIEVDPAASVRKSCAAGYGISIYNRNFLTEASEDLFDLVVSNPPYKSINKSDAKRLGLDWEYIRLAGRNLYGLAIIRAIEACKTEGLVAFIAPHGWLNNQHCQGLREIVGLNTSEICVEGFRRRNLFPGVSQDVAFQFFHLREPNPEATTSVRFSMDGVESEFLLSESPQAPNQPDPQLESFRVRVGPLVWNRERELLHADSRGLPVVNGGNISADGNLTFNQPLYKERQYASSRKLPITYISTAPLILIKRTMRGRPGHWRVDSVLVSEDGFRCVAENHVIVVEPLTSEARHSISHLYMTLSIQIEKIHRHHGHANISVELVRRALINAFDSPPTKSKSSLRLHLLNPGRTGCLEAEKSLEPFTNE